METRAHHVLIGAFVLMMAVGFLGFIFWVVKSDVDTEYDYYTVYFDSAVTGLSPSGAVRLNGIYVGDVQTIRFDEQDVSRVRVDIRVYSRTPITTETYATLEVQGLTGVSFVQLINEDDGDGKPGKRLESKDPDERPVIPSKVSGLQGVFMSAPELLEAGIKLLDQATKLLSDDNIALVNGMLADAKTLTGGVAEKTPELQESIVLFRDSMQSVKNIASTLEGVTEEDVPALIGDLRTAAANFEKLSGTLNDTVEENRPAISNFTQTALPELAQFATDARRLAAALVRIAEQMEQDPSSLIFSPKKPEVEAGK